MLVGVVGSLVLCCVLLGLSRGLLQDCRNPGRSLYGRFMKEGHNIERLVQAKHVGDEWLSWARGASSVVGKLEQQVWS